jgi:hypothetical protein
LPEFSVKLKPLILIDSPPHRKDYQLKATSIAQKAKSIAQKAKSIALEVRLVA